MKTHPSVSASAGAMEVPVERLRRTLDPDAFRFTTTADVEPLTGTIGQPRALQAIELGLDVRAPGYNLYVAGAAGSAGRRRRAST